MTISVKRRAFLVFVALAFLGWLAALTGNPFSAGFGLGLFFPGSGFVYTGQWLLLLLTLVLFALAFFVWFASGNILAPAGIWLGAALAAGLFAREMPEDELSSSAVWLVPTIVVLLGTWIQVSGKRTYRKRLETLESRNSYLSATTFEPVPAPAYDENYWGELSLDDLKALRFNLDRALQPLDEFNGFEWHEFQFQFAAVRYQLNYLNYGLHVYQQRYAPNFHGYLNQGQRNLIEKALNKRVWGYWRWEALWGQLTTDFDPFRKENIMLSGWWGVNVAAYTSNTGDQRYMEPGSLTFRYNEVQYPYDLGRIAEAVHRNHTESDWCLYACEPNWVYNMCNESGMTLLMQYDKMYGTDYFSSLEQRFFENIQNEFTTADGRVIALRSQRIGFSVPLLTSPTADAQFGLLASPLQSQLAQRVWKILRTDLSRIKPDGEVEIDTQGWDEIDGGNYRPSNISTYLNVRMIAREMGDEEMADAIERTMKNQHDFRSDAELNYFADGSVMANAMYVLGNLLKKNGWHDFIKYTLPENITSGPLLEECEYPQVLVAKAVSHDGEGLELVLYPGSEQTNQVIGIARLQPGKQYTLSCGDTAEIYEADDEGKLRCEITLENRTEIQLTPA